MTIPVAATAQPRRIQVTQTAEPRGKVETEVLELCGREVVIMNPDKVVFPDAGHTKLDLVRNYLSVAEGALRGVVADAREVGGIRV